jgi:hypothetical protein
VAEGYARGSGVHHIRLPSDHFKYLSAEKVSKLPHKGLGAGRRNPKQRPKNEKQDWFFDCHQGFRALALAACGV